MFPENLQLREDCFRKMGAEWKIVSKLYGDSCWAWALNDNQFGLDCHYEPNGITVDPKPELLPPIETDWQVTAEYLVPFMRGKGFIYMIGHRRLDYWKRLNKNQFFKWYCTNGWCSKGSAEIKDDNLALAACEAFEGVEI